MSSSHVQIPSCEQESKRSPCRNRWSSCRATPEQEAEEEIEDHYEDEPRSKFSGSLFDTEEGFHRNRHMRAFLHDNQRQTKPANASDSSKQQVCKLENDTGRESRCPEQNESQARLLISTGFKGTWTKLNITVRSQMGSLGISIAGGKGSTPYKINDEGVFISKVSKGGPADLAGVQVGDMVLEVNGISLQNVTHHEAVNTLRNSGTVIKILILRDRAFTVDGTVASNVNSGEADNVRPPQTVWPCFITQPAASSEQPESRNAFLEGKMTTTCNGNSSELPRSASCILSQKVYAQESMTSKNITVNSASETLQKSTSFRIVSHAMPTPKIILTCPSSSDEELEQLTLEQDVYYLEQFENSGSSYYSDYLSSAFCPL